MIVLSTVLITSTAGEAPFTLCLLFALFLFDGLSIVGVVVRLKLPVSTSSPIDDATDALPGLVGLIGSDALPGLMGLSGSDARRGLVGLVGLVGLA